MQIKERSFGADATLFALVNDNGVKLEVTNYGARIVSLWVPTAEGEKNIVLGFDSKEEYAAKDTYIGATIGRVAGRIAGGTFELDGTHYETPKNERNNTLHGGPQSFEEKNWDTQIEENEGEVAITFSYTSPDGENDFPGELFVAVRYSLNNENEWQVSYTAKTDQTTLFNPTNHVYFNLTGDVTQNVAEHELSLAADEFVILNDQTLTTGEIRDVSGTPFDFRRGALLKQAFETDYEQNQLVNGLDHPFMLKQETTPQAILTAPKKDIAVEMTTTEPTVVIFTAQFDEIPEMRGEKLAFHGGITLETQVTPGALEHGFGQIILHPQETFASTTTYKLVF